MVIDHVVDASTPLEVHSVGAPVIGENTRIREDDNVTRAGSVKHVRQS